MSNLLASTTTLTPASKGVVLVDKYQPQLFDFNRAVVFEEKPLSKKFSIELCNEEGTVFLAETSLLYLNQIRIVCAKNVEITEGSPLKLSLTAIYEKLAEDFFLNIPCSLSKVEKFKNITHAIVTFADNVDSQFSSWYQQWLEKSKRTKSRYETNENAFNFIYQYYKRLYCVHLAHPVLFSDDDQIKHSFISRQGNSVITFTTEDNTHICLPTNIIHQYIDSPTKKNRIPLYVWYENNCIHYFSSKDHPSISPKKIISWLKNKSQWRVLLIRNYKTVSAEEAQLAEVRQYVSEDAILNASSFEEDFLKYPITTNILDISCLFQQIHLPKYEELLQAHKVLADPEDNNYQVLSFKVKRSEARYQYITAVKLTAVEQSPQVTIETETTDISYVGLSIKIPETECSFIKKETVMVEFIQWNEMQPKSLLKKKEKFAAVKYKVVNLIKKKGFIILGVDRLGRDTSPNFNIFVQNKIDELNETGARGIRNDFDLYQSLVSSIWVNNNIAGLVFFLGKDSDGVRIIQAIANTRENLKLSQPYRELNDWSFLQKIALSLGLAIHDINSENTPTTSQLNIGIYCYFDDSVNHPHWKTQTDLDFNSSESKTAFIRTAISFKKHYFYHCSLVPIKSGKDDILNGESSCLVSVGARRLKEIHEICRSLLAVGEFNDATNLIEFMHS